MEDNNILINENSDSRNNKKVSIIEWWKNTKPLKKTVILLVGIFAIAFFIVLLLLAFDKEDIDYEKPSDSYYDTSIKTLSDYMMSLEEYRDVYIKSGFEYTEHSHEEEQELYKGDYCQLYENKNTESDIRIYDFDESIGVWITLGSGESKDYENMLAPAFLYIKDLPGAILDVNEIVNNWNETDKALPAEGIYETSFKQNGIEYIRNRNTNTDSIIILIKAFREHTVEENYVSKPTISIKPYTADNNQENFNQSAHTDNSKQNTSAQSNTENDNYNTNNYQYQEPSKSNPEKSNEASHMCILEPQYEIIHHDEEGHYEDVQVYEWVTVYCCPVCYNKYDTVEECHQHAIGHNNEHFSFEVDEYETTETYRARTEQRWFVDKIEWDEKIIVSNKCIICGKVVEQ